MYTRENVMTVKLQTISARDSHFFADCIIILCIWNSLPGSFVAVRIARCFNVRLESFIVGSLSLDYISFFVRFFVS